MRIFFILPLCAISSSMKKKNVYFFPFGRNTAGSTPKMADSFTIWLTFICLVPASISEALEGGLGHSELFLSDPDLFASKQCLMSPSSTFARIELARTHALRALG
jgi:hypothetical protein